jgi:hypothetical protein
MIGGAWRAAGTTRFGSGLGAASGAAVTAGLAGAGFATGAVAAGFCAAALEIWLRRAASSSAFFFSAISFATSPGLCTCDRSILG